MISFRDGRTFDKNYDELTGSLVFKDTHLAEMLRWVEAASTFPSGR